VNPLEQALASLPHVPSFVLSIGYHNSIQAKAASRIHGSRDEPFLKAFSRQPLFRVLLVEAQRN